MKHDHRTYASLLLVFVLSVGFASLLPAEALLREIAAIPAVGALLAAVFQILRDQAGFERQQISQQQQQAFSLGATSHMANVAFDKHVEFCEKYVAEVHSTVVSLFREGPTEKALKHVWNFAELRRQYAAWLPRDIVEGLDRFETAVTRIGSLSYLVEALRGTTDPGRQPAIAEMYDVFRDVLNIPSDTPAERRPDVAIEAVKEKVRAILGIEHLTKLRRRLVQQALSAQ